MTEFNYKGVVFQAETDIDEWYDPSWDSHPVYIIMKVFHEGEEVTECLHPDTLEKMEESLNRQIGETNE